MDVAIIWDKNVGECMVETAPLFRLFLSSCVEFVPDRPLDADDIWKDLFGSSIVRAFCRKCLWALCLEYAFYLDEDQQMEYVVFRLSFFFAVLIQTTHIDF